MKRVMMVSKPVRPPWTDSSKNLVRDVVSWSERTHYAVMGGDDFGPDWPRVRWDSVYRDAGKYAPGLRQNARAFGHILGADREIGLFHFFFAPNPVTCTALRPLAALKGRPTVHSVCSVPQSFQGIDRLLFSDAVIALSESTTRQLEDAGVEGVRCIPPGIDPTLLQADPASDLPDALGVRGRPVILFAGDYEVGGGAQALVASLPTVIERVPEVMLVLACRLKTGDARELEDQVRQKAASAGLLDRIVFLNEVDRMGDLLGLADIVTLPVTSTYRKMDIPLVLLEAMAMGIPVVVSDTAPIRETVAHGGGMAVPLGDGDALGSSLGDLLANGGQRSRLGQEALEAVEAYWHVRRTASQYEDLYEELLNPQ